MAPRNASETNSWKVKTLRCCWCNDKGSCTRCRCVKNTFPCANCLPLKRGHCQNPPDLTQIIRPTSNLSPSQLGKLWNSVSTLANIHSTLQSPTPPPTTSSPPLGTSHTDHVVADLLHLDGTPVDSPCLPPPTSVTEPNFTWGVLDAVSFRKIIHEAYVENYFIELLH